MQVQKYNRDVISNRGREVAYVIMIVGGGVILTGATLSINSTSRYILPPTPPESSFPMSTNLPHQLIPRVCRLDGCKTIQPHCDWNAQNSTVFPDTCADLCAERQHVISEAVVCRYSGPSPSICMVRDIRNASPRYLPPCTAPPQYSPLPIRKLPTIRVGKPGRVQ